MLMYAFIVLIRITSYNVCYTKLLRHRGVTDGGDDVAQGLDADGGQEPAAPVAGGHDAGDDHQDERNNFV